MKRSSEIVKASGLFGQIRLVAKLLRRRRDLTSCGEIVGSQLCTRVTLQYPTCLTSLSPFRSLLQVPRYQYLNSSSLIKQFSLLLPRQLFYSRPRPSITTIIQNASEHTCPCHLALSSRNCLGRSHLRRADYNCW